MRWLLIMLLMCNGIYFVWQHYLVVSPERAGQAVAPATVAGNSGVATIELLEPLPVAAVDNTAPVRESKREEQAVCWQIGPFGEEVSARQVVSRLDAMQISLQEQVVEVAGEPDYWVHIPPLPSRKLANAVLRELQAKKIDSFLITQGELNNGISLGIFTQQNRAEAVLAQRRQQGYAATIKQTERITRQIWLVYDSSQYGELSDELWETIEEGNKGLQRHKNFCEKIASSSQFD